MARISQFNSAGQHKWIKIVPSSQEVVKTGRKRSNENRIGLVKSISVRIGRKTSGQERQELA